MLHTKHALNGSVRALASIPPPRCVDGLFEALSQIYTDQESSSVLRLTQKVAAVFAKGNRFADGAELEELKQIRADAQARLKSPTLSVRVIRKQGTAVAAV